MHSIKPLNFNADELIMLGFCRKVYGVSWVAEYSLPIKLAILASSLCLHTLYLSREALCKFPSGLFTCKPVQLPLGGPPASADRWLACGVAFKSSYRTYVEALGKTQGTLSVNQRKKWGWDRDYIFWSEMKSDRRSEGENREIYGERKMRAGHHLNRE